MSCSSHKCEGTGGCNIHDCLLEHSPEKNLTDFGQIIDKINTYLKL